MIQIKSKKPLVFDVVTRKKGIITVEIVSYTRNPNSKTFTLNINDTMTFQTEYKWMDVVPEYYDKDGVYHEAYEKEVIDVMEDSETKHRQRTYKDSELLALVSQIEGLNETLNIDDIINQTDDLFSKGLLLITQQECLEGKGIYMSEAEDWFIPTK